MNDPTRILRRAREVWQASAPSNAVIARGADRIAQRLSTPRSTWSQWYSWTTIGAAAALLGSIVQGAHVTALQGVPPSITTSIPPIAPTVDAPSPPRANVVAPPEPSSPELAAPPPEKGEPARALANEPAEPRVPTAERHMVDEPTWMDVSAALAGGDHPLAERLLIVLADRRHDASTRAKANLGLAQLDEARGDCASAKQHALRASAIPDVDIKTVRRALELVARCNH